MNADKKLFEPEFSVTVFTDLFGREKRQSDKATLAVVQRSVERAHAKTREGLELLSLSTFGDERSEESDCLRHSGNVKAVWGIEGDYDGELVTPEEAREKLEEAGIEALIFTSPSHRPDAPRFRVIAPFSEPLAPNERARMMARLNGVLGGTLDDTCFNLSQSFFFGQVEGRAKPTCYRARGQTIDELDELDLYAIGRSTGGRKREAGEMSGEKCDVPLDVLQSALEAIPNDGERECENDRHWWFTIVAAWHLETDGSVEGYEIIEKWSERWPGHDQDHLSHTWRSLGRRKFGTMATGRTILAEARQLGWRDPSIAEEFENLEEETEIAEAEAMDDRSHPEQIGTLELYTPNDCAAFDSTDYVIKGFIGPRQIGCIFADPGAGKSVIAPYLAHRVATGERAFGMRTRAGSVLYIAAEDQAGLRRRVWALSEEYGQADGLQVVCNVSDLTTPSSENIQSLVEAVNRKSPKLIAIDTLAAAFPGIDENSNEGMNRVVTVARGLARRGAAVILIHHGTKNDGTTPRGHSVLNGALDVTMHLEKQTQDGIIRGAVKKNRNGSQDLDIAFRIGSHFLLIDEDGDEHTAPYAIQCNANEVIKTPKHSPAQRAFLRLLTDMQGDLRGADVDEEELIKAAVAGRKVSSADEDANRRRAVRRVIQCLAQRQEIYAENGRIRLPSSADEFAELDDQNVGAFSDDDCGSDVHPEN